MPTFMVTDPDTGLKARLTGDSPPTEQELTEVFSSLQPNGDSLPGNQKEEAGILEGSFSGLMEGFKRFGEGIEQKLREIDIKQEEFNQPGFLGFNPSNPLNDIEKSVDAVSELSEKLKAFKDQVVIRREQFEQSPEGQSFSGQAGKVIGETLPALAVPGGVQGGLVRRGVTGALAGAGLGAVQFSEQDQTATNTTLGAFAGAAGPLIGVGGKKLFDVAAPLFGIKTAGLIKQLGGDKLLRSSVQRIDSAKRLGLDLTPAEATADAALAAKQGKLGSSGAGLKTLGEFGGKRVQQENEAITKFLSDISPSGSSAGGSIRKTAQRILNDENKILADAARPFYQKAYPQEIPEPDFERLLNDPVVAEAYKNVLKRPTWQRELGDAKLNSIKTLDLAKRDMDGTFESLTVKGRKDEARIVLQAKEQLLSLADEISPDYKTARDIFSVDARGVRKLESGIVGKLSRLEDNSLKNVSKVLFDPGETDITVLSKLNKRFLKEDPEAWKRIIRNEMERRLDASAKDIGGSVFFDSILRKDRDFRLFLTATKGMPTTRKALIDMRRVFKNLINPITVKTAAGQAKSSLDVPRSSAQFIFESLERLAGGKSDKAAVEIITNPKWHEELNKVLAGNGKAEKLDKLVALFGKVGAIELAN